MSAALRPWLAVSGLVAAGACGRVGFTPVECGDGAQNYGFCAEPRAWTHEPAGFTVIIDDPWDTVNGWLGSGGSATIEPDLNAPLSPPNVLQFFYPVDFVGGSPPDSFTRALGSPTELYVGFWWKASNPWDGHAGGINHLIRVTTGGTQDSIFFLLNGAGSGPFDTRCFLQFASNDDRFENMNPDSITLGEWHQMELYMRYNGANGELRWWVDGVIKGDYADVSFPHNDFDSLAIYPAWGGTGDLKASNDYFWFDHIRVSRP